MNPNPFSFRCLEFPTNILRSVTDDQTWRRKKEKKPTSTSQQSQQKYLIKLESGLFNGPSSPIISFKKQQYCHQIHSPFRRTDFQVPAVSFRECMPAGTPQKKPVEAWKGAATWSNIERNKVVSWRLFEKKLMSSATSHLFWSNIFFILACCWNIFYLHEYRENFMVQKVSHIYNMNLKLWKKNNKLLRDTILMIWGWHGHQDWHHCTLGTLEP